MATYYTIHSRRTWKNFLEQGFLEGHRDFAMFPKQYEWLMQETAIRLPNYNGVYPVWLWTEIPPEYRSSNSMVARKKYVLLTIELEEKDVLLSDFEAWHIPLNDHEFEVENEVSNPPNWDKVFDFDWLRKNFYEDEDAKIVLQGTTGRISTQHVVKVKNFTTKK